LNFQNSEDIAAKDEVVDLIVELCDTHTTNVKKAKCVIEFLDNHYKYVKHNESFRKLQDFLDKGGVCRDFAINACAILNQMDIECSYVFTEGHVFPVIQIGPQQYCTFDQGRWNCS